jgi:hypothetical protein
MRREEIRLDSSLEPCQIGIPASHIQTRQDGNIVITSTQRIVQDHVLSSLTLYFFLVDKLESFMAHSRLGTDFYSYLLHSPNSPNILPQPKTSSIRSFFNLLIPSHLTKQQPEFDEQATVPLLCLYKKGYLEDENIVKQVDMRESLFTLVFVFNKILIV